MFCPKFLHYSIKFVVKLYSMAGNDRMNKDRQTKCILVDVIKKN